MIMNNESWWIGAGPNRIILNQAKEITDEPHAKSKPQNINYVFRYYKIPDDSRI
jgi:hypothetical protein